MAIGWEFQSRNRETYDSNDIDERQETCAVKFQSRNRETYDSNDKVLGAELHIAFYCFNLVIEKLMIPTFQFVRKHRIAICEFQSRNRETYDSNYSVLSSVLLVKFLFQSRNRETYDSNATLF